MAKTTRLYKGKDKDTALTLNNWLKEHRFNSTASSYVGEAYDLNTGEYIETTPTVYTVDVVEGDSDDPDETIEVEIG